MGQRTRAGSGRWVGLRQSYMELNKTPPIWWIYLRVFYIKVRQVRQDTEVNHQKNFRWRDVQNYMH